MRASTPLFDYSLLPEYLMSLPRWIGFNLIHRPGGKTDKIPIDPRTGKGSRWQSPTSQLTFEVAHALYIDRALCDGLGFVLMPEDHLTFVDLDNVNESEDRKLTALEIARRLGTWGEFSQSGKGAHFFVKGTVQSSWNKSRENGTEAYSHGRFVAVTGRRIPQAPLFVAENQAGLDWFYSSFSGKQVDVHMNNNLIGRPSSLLNPVIIDVRPPPTRNEVDSPLALARVRSALEAVTCDSYEIWLHVGMSLHSTHWLSAKAIWDEWSKTSKKYDLSVQQQKWNSFCTQAGPTLTLGSLFHLAKQNGWSDTAAQKYVDDFNAEYFVAAFGGRVNVFRERYDPILRRDHLDALSEREFVLLHANEFVTSGQNKEPRQAARLWLHHPQRREYRDIIFAPGLAAPKEAYNLWKGFAVHPTQGDWSLLRDHIREVICGGVAEYGRYLEGWLAYAVQRPGEPAGVSVVLRGGKGTGKGTLGNALLRLFGRHGLHITNGQHLTGHFNQHLRNCVFLFADEAFYAGDRKGEAVLKGLITEPSLMIEAKGRDAVQAKNCLHVLMASNADWAVPVSHDERRFFLLDVLDIRRQDISYFGALNQQLETGGYEAMLFDLLCYDLAGFDIRRPPVTRSLYDQKLVSLDLPAQWLFERLKEGRLRNGDVGWVSQQIKQHLVNDFTEFCRQVGRDRFNAHATSTRLGVALKKILRETLLDARPTINGRREWCWQFPALEESRQQFDKYLSGH